MKNAKRLIAILMSVFFLISLIPTIVLADVTEISNQYGVGVNRIILTPAKHPHITSNASVGGIGGKSADDTAYVFTAGEIPEGATVYGGTAGAEYSGLDYKDYAFEANIYFDGGAEATVNYNYEETNYRLLHFRSDGTLEYNVNGTMKTHSKKYAPGQWHRVVVWFNGADGSDSRSRHTIYVDGEFITADCKYMSPAEVTRMVAGIYAPTSQNGKVAFDDFKLYYTGGDYTPDANDAIVTNSSDDLIFDADTKTIKYDSSVYASSDAVVTAIKTATGATYANFVDDNTVVFTSPNGKTYSYWSIRALSREDAIFANYYGENGSVAIRNSGNYKYTHITHTGESTETLGGRVGKSYALTIGEIPSGLTVSHTSGMYYAPDATKNYTFETSVYFDGNAYPAVNAMWDDDLEASTLIKVGADGYVYYNNYGTTTKSTVFAESGKWHRMVVEFQQSRGRFALYFDGTLLTDSTYGYNSTTAGKFWIGTAAHSYSGKVVYADFTAYYDAYVSDADDAIKTENSDNLTFDTSGKTLTYNKFLYATNDALVDAVKAATGAAYANVMNDSTIVFTSPNGKSYAYYTLKEMSEDEAAIKSVGLSSGSSLVYVLDSSIGVVSHSLDDEYYTDSTEVIAALSSSNGYTLSYVDADKNELEDVDPTVTDGYIKATADGKPTFYIPVVTKGIENTDFTKLPSGAGVTWKNDYSSYLTIDTVTTEAIGGKAASDIDCVISAKSEIPAGTMAKTTGAKYTSLPAIPTTFEMNVFVDGDAEFAVNIQYREDMYNVLRIKPDGTIVYTYKNFGNIMTSPFKAESGKWHKVAITYDVQRTRCHIYVDGNLITDTTPSLTAKTIMIGAGSGTKNGKVAIADFVNYYGFYNYIDVVRVEDGKITASVDSDLLDGECFFALAEYVDGEMVNLAPVTVTKANNQPVTLNFSADSTYKVFLWKNDASAPIATSVYYR